jgi:hypothetical protein
VRVRIRIPTLGVAEQQALDRKARMFFGRHADAIDAVEIAWRAREDDAARHAECDVHVVLRDGGELRVHDDGDHVHRALLRAAWRVEQRRAVERVRRGEGARTARSAP